MGRRIATTTVQKIMNECNIMAKIYRQIKKIHRSPWSISIQGKIATYYNKQKLYAYTYGHKKLIPYQEEDRKPFPQEQETDISEKTKFITKLWMYFFLVWCVLNIEQEQSHNLFSRYLQRNEHIYICAKVSCRHYQDPLITIDQGLGGSTGHIKH